MSNTLFGGKARLRMRHKGCALFTQGCCDFYDKPVQLKSGAIVKGVCMIGVCNAICKIAPNGMVGRDTLAPPQFYSDSGVYKLAK